MNWLALIKSPIVIKLLIALVIAISSSVATYRYLSNSHELELLKLKDQYTQLELELEKEKSKKQGEVFQSAFEASEKLTNALNDNKAVADKLKGQLKGAVLVTKDCKPTEEFVNIWNGSHSR